MKNVVIIDGTHNKQWFTVKLIEAFKDGLMSKFPDANIHHYDLINEDVKVCKGCGFCTKDQQSEIAPCKIKDDVWAEIILEALHADVIVFASPIYEYAVSSTMKRFLERCLPLAKFKFGIVPRRPLNKKKTGIILCVSGAPYPINFLMGIARYPKFILTKIAKFFGCATIKSLYPGMMNNPKTQKRYLAKARHLGASL